MHNKPHTLWQEIKMDFLANHNHPFTTKHFIGALFFNDGFQLLLSYRLQHRLIAKGFISRTVTKFLYIWNIYLFGCSIMPKAKLAGGIRIDHANGIMISTNTIIESGVTLCQQVTIGVKILDELASPHIKRNAIIYAGAKVFGNIIIGENAIIGANAVVLQSVPDNCMAMGVPAVIKRVMQSNAE